MYRYIPWIYVGISTRTGVSCLRQYLEVVASTGPLPHSIRSDRGTETMMMASAHWRLHQAICPDRQFHKVWWYGTSTLNQRIEAWWRHMSRSQTLAWKVGGTPFTSALSQTNSVSR